MQEIYYYSGKREVDFIIVQGNNVIDAIQVTWSLSDPLTEKKRNRWIIRSYEYI